MKTTELKELYLRFFESKGHKRISHASLIPENDPSVLFTTAGMHPLVPFLLGQPHPSGKRLCNVQICIRTGDIDEVGDASHLTFFEMLGNWSLGDYFKEDAIKWSHEFLTGKDWLNLSVEKLAVTCFKGDNDSPLDIEAAEVWRKLGIPEERIAFLEKEDNWWGPAGETGPCGPDSEMFYWTGPESAPKVFDPKDKHWVEIWNDVFMQYNKNKDGSFTPLTQQNVDTGLGVERVSMVLQGKTNVYEIDQLHKIVEKIKEITLVHRHLTNAQTTSIRIIADHIRACTFILGDHRGVTPSNVDQGYILRRFIRRIIRHLRLLGAKYSGTPLTLELSKVVIDLYHKEYPALEEKKEFILGELKKEETKFRETLENGLKMFDKLTSTNKDMSKEDAFLLFQSYGFPIEMIEELAAEQKISVDTDGFKEEFKKHQELSRVGAEKKFKGGLSDSSDMSTKLHTATHLLNEALRRVLGEDIKQKGSNITPERLRFDFNFERKLTSDEIKAVEQLVNKQIELGIDVIRDEMTFDEAKKQGAQAEFGAKYPQVVSVYSVGDFSKEICGGPHVSNTRELGNFKILKEESSAQGIRRIKAVLK
ncbi:MAG: alanine--tRNA ligase [Candidatus Nanoarchaeia archaeon]